MPPQSLEERREKKRQAEMRRRARIKNDTELHNAVKMRARERYYRRKAEGKVIPVSEMSSVRKRAVRKQNRIKSRLFRQRKKTRESFALQENEIECPRSPDLIEDPLCSPKSPTPQIMPASLPESQKNDFISRRVTRQYKKHIEASCSSEGASLSRSSRFLPELHKPTYSSALTSQPKPAAKCDTPVSTRPLNTSSTRLRLNDDLPASPHHSDYDSDNSTFSDSVNSNSNYSSCSSSALSSPTNSIRSKKYVKSKVTRKRKSSVKFSRRYIDKENLMHKRIHELKLLNCKYRKQLSRMKRNILFFKGRNADNDTDSTTSSQSCEQFEHDGDEISKDNHRNKLEMDVQNFYENDENSRMCAGKNESVTKNKIKKQKRYLNDTMQNLHEKFLKLFPVHRISYSHFCKLRPFWVQIPNVRNRETCLCTPCANIDLLVASLRRNNIISEGCVKDVMREICCDPKNMNCLSRKCLICQHKSVNYKQFDNSKLIHYDTWKKTKVEYVKNGEVKKTIKTAKEKITATPKDVIIEFEKKMDPFMLHHLHMISQYSFQNQLKQNLGEQEAIIHCDFSQNYETKYSNEIQAFHFGSSRTQITLHTVVIYYLMNGKLESKSFCTLSQCLRHDAVAIWEHLIPVLSYIENNCPFVNRLHFLSDSPSAQYRNKKMFFIIAKLHWYFTNLKFVSWNYSESGHGKGAPDGVGGTLKRTADQIVARGNDIPNLDSFVEYLKTAAKNVILEVVDEAGMFEKELLIPPLPEFRGTMNIHQILWEVNQKNTLTMRKLSCSFDECGTSAVECKHGMHLGFYNIDPNESQFRPNSNKTHNRSLIKRSKATVTSYQNKEPEGDQNQKTSNSCDKLIPTQISGPNKRLTVLKNVEFRSNAEYSKNANGNELDLPSTDSFWQDVSSLDSECLNRTFVKNLMNAENPEIDGNKNIDFYDSDEDLNIF